MSRPKLRSISRKVEGGKKTPRSRSVKHDEAMEVTRPKAGRIRQIIPENIIAGVGIKDFVGKDNYEFGETKPLAASEYLDKNSNISVKEDGREDVTIPGNTFIMGDIVDVTVCLAISPSYFVIQTNSSALELEQLSIDMFSFYEEQAGGVMVKSDHVMKGKIVAVRHEEGEWYRGRVTEVLTVNHVMVRLLDYGDLEMVEVQDMRVMEIQFMLLPAQAVNARVSGVMPALGDWGREDEDWWVTRVEGGMFVAQVGDSWEAGGDVVVELLLYDTSQEEDIVLQDEMVQLGIAMYIQSY